MRVTFNMMAMRYHNSIGSALSNMLEAADRVNAQRNILTPEQDATAYVSAYNIQRMIDELTQFKTNAESANGWVSNSDKVLTTALEQLKKAKNDFAIGGANASNDATSRLAMATEVAGILETIKDYANTSYLGRHIFAGFQTDTSPFESGKSAISNVFSNLLTSSDVITKPVYSDLSELGSGSYKADISVINGIATLTVRDINGKLVTLDSTGSDQSNTKGNGTTTALTFEFKPGEVINTGRGFSITMPDETPVVNTTVSFNYKSGSEVSYHGDQNSIFAQIGYNQNIGINTPGSDIFMQSFKSLLSTKTLTANGLKATYSTLFSALDNANFSFGNAINITGSDHLGKPIGSSSILSPINPKLDHTKTSDEERTLKVTYGDKVYQITIPQGVYPSTEQLSEAIQIELKNAEYLGTIPRSAEGFKNIEDYENYIQQQMEDGYFKPATDADKTKYQVDLSKELTVTADGDKLSFNTNKSGDDVRIAVSGSSLNALGFKNLTVASQGKDTSFEFGPNYDSVRIENIFTSHTSINFTTGGNYKFVVNGKPININIPARGPITATNIGTNTNLSGATDFNLTIAGQNITVNAGALGSVNTLAEKEAIINSAIADAGFGGEHSVSLVANGTNFDIELNSISAPTKKDIEFELNKALNNAGFSHTIGASLVPVNSSDPDQLGQYTLNFYSVNTNIDKTTHISSQYIDESVIPNRVDLQTDAPELKEYGLGTDKSIGDYIDFLNELYSGSAEASLVNGKIQLKDETSGDKSKLTFFQNPTNSGISIPSDNNINLSGKYTGNTNSNWDIEMHTTLSPDGQVSVKIIMYDTYNRETYEQNIPNYHGEAIYLANGVSMTLNEDQLPTLAEPTKSTGFDINLVANSNLTLGDMKTVDPGENINIFRALTNLEHALKYNIIKNGFAAPSSWKNTTLGSTANPFADGIYQGSYNDNWNYEVMQNGSQSEYYLQNEYSTSTGDINFDAATINDLGNSIAFGVNIHDNLNNTNSTVDVNIDLSKANPPLTDAKSTQKYIISELNNDSRFQDEGITFKEDNGKITMTSNSGTKIVSFEEIMGTIPANANTGTLTKYILGLEPLQNEPISTFPLDLAAGGDTTFHITDIGDTANPIKEITLPPPAVYATKEELVTAINLQLGVGTPTNGRVTATVNSAGVLEFRDLEESTDFPDGKLVASYGNTNLGIISSETASTTAAKGAQKPRTDLSDESEEARTLTFKYIDTAGNQVKKSITLDKKEYTSPEEMVADINRLIAADATIPAGLVSRLDSNGNIAFTTSDVGAPPTIRSLSVENEYGDSKSGPALGFPKAGDEATIRVSSENGGLIQEVKINSANSTKYIADGLYLGFDKGTLTATDSFSIAIGSGIENEISTLEQAEKQFLEALLQIGNKLSRVETVTIFHTTVIESNEKTKAEYLGSTPEAITKAITEHALAKMAYESALSSVTQMMSISLLNFLN